MFDVLKKIKSVFDPNEWELKKLRKHLEKVNVLEKEMEKLSDDELKAKTGYFRDLLKQGMTLDDILPEAFAVVREVARRTVGMRPYDVQIIGGVVLHQGGDDSLRGRIAEMKTGEGKTLVATLPVYLNALTGEGVHLVTTNDYLAKRDARWMGPVYHFLGLTVGVIQHDTAYQYDPDHLVGDESLDMLRPIPRREAYHSDITYGTNNEFGFDYLRDNMVMELEERVQRELVYAIVDEVDSILIDEARTPLIISGRGVESSDNYRRFASSAAKLRKDKHYEVKEKEHSVILTDEGYNKIDEPGGFLDSLGIPKSVSFHEYQDEDPSIFPEMDLPEEIGKQYGATGKDDGNMKNLYDRGNSYIKRKKFSSAIKSFDLVIEKDPENLTAWIRKGVAYDKWGKRDEALKCIRRVISHRPEFVNVIGKEGLNYDKLRELQESLTKKDANNAGREETSESIGEIQFVKWYNKGCKALSRDDQKNAIASFSKAIDIKPDSVEARTNLGVAFFMQSNNRKALENFQKVHNMDPESPEVLYNLGIAFRWAREYDKAINCYEKALELDPDFYAAHNNLGAIYINLYDMKKDQEDLQKALESFEKAVEFEESAVDENKPEGLIYSGEDGLQKSKRIAENFNQAKKVGDIQMREYESKFPKHKVPIQQELDNPDKLTEQGIEGYMQNALKARELFKRDVDYVIKEGEIIIVDEFTGRLMYGRRYSDGLHQAIEAKENVKVRSEDQTLASITFQNYFRMYKKLAGMTGTAATEEKEFRQIYNVDVVIIPTNRPLKRDSLPDRIYKTEEIKFRAIIKEIEELNEIGRPVLVGSRSIEKSEVLSMMLKKKGIKHNVLNAKHHEREAQIVAETGRSGGVTIATNMAGRGVDIILGGSPPDSEYEHNKYLSAQNHLDLVTEQLGEFKQQLTQTESELEESQKESQESKTRMMELRNLQHTDEIQGKIEEESKASREINDKIHELNESARELKKKIQTNVEFLPDLEKKFKSAQQEYEEKKNEVAIQMKEHVREQTKVKELKGLHIIGTERHESRRIDNQLRGRSGRQGDPGSSRFYVALEDELMRLFGSDRLPDWLTDWAEDEDTPLEHGLFTKSIENAQKKVESHHFDVRKSVLDYDNVMDGQRKVIYDQRDRILRGENLRPVIESFIEAEVDNHVMLYCPDGLPFEEWDLESLYNSSKEIFIPLPSDASVKELETTDNQKIREKVLDWATFAYDLKEDRLGPELMRIMEQWTVLRIVDEKWMDHLARMDDLREGIGLRGYGQRDPLVEYINESHKYFETMNQSIRSDAVKFLFRAYISPEAVEAHRQSKYKVTREHHGEGGMVAGGGSTTVRKGKKVGRNAPCPCGSGKKYKKCCGR
ncbi:MAG: preprotein translocase subunit SecA [Candidatus Eremiobacteraeota bacterium]|nr:preprotein translocase subunit SecA [Candidatus Eremiobacteraeota bacterium]